LLALTASGTKVAFRRIEVRDLTAFPAEFRK